MAKYTISVPPSTEPITTAEAKTHCFIESANTDWDTYIGTLIKAAREFTELYLARALMPQTIIEYWDCFPDVTDNNTFAALPLRWAPVASVTNVKYLNTSGVETTLVVTTDYKADLIDQPPALIPAYAKSWPTTRDEVNSVYVTYVAGYANAAAVPQAIKQAMLLQIKDWFDCRDNGVQMLTTKLEKLLDLWRVYAL